MNKQRISPLIVLLTCLAWCAGVLAAAQDVVLVLDNSGSMRKIDPGLVAKRAAADFLQGLPAEVNIGIIIFDQTARLVAPLTLATEAAKAALKATLDGMNYRGPFTDGPGAIERAIYELKTNGRPGAARSIVFVSDGVVDTGDQAKDVERAQWLREKLSAEAAAGGIRILPIAFTENADLLMLQSLASSTGGDYVRAPLPSDLAAAYQATQQRLLAVVAPPAPATVEPPIAPPAPEAVAPAAPAPNPPILEPAPAVEPPPEAPAPSETAPASGNVKLNAEEMAALEQLAKDTGVPVEQLLQELDSAPAGQAVVVRPDESPPAAAEQPAPSMNLVWGGIGVAALAGLGVWLMRRGRRSPAAAAAGASTAGKATARQKSPEGFLIDLHGLTGDPARRITEKPVMVGRTAGTDAEYLDYFVINKATVGRRHAIIKFKDYAFWVVDQGSVNGTYVNNEKVLGERQLKHGDRIKFHKFEFEFSYPDMADASKTVIGITADQTIVASHDSTMSATSSALRAGPLSTIARVGGGSVTTGAAAVVGTSAWLNRDALGKVPGSTGDEDVFDVTKEGDLESLESDRNDFFSGSGQNPAFAAPPEPSTGDDTFDDEAFSAAPPEGEDEDEELGVEINLEAIGEADNTKLIHKDTSIRPTNFDGDASAFFEDVTVGPAPDLMKGPAVGDEPGDFVDATKVPGIGDDDATANYAPPSTVLGGLRPGERTGTKPPMDTGSFGELTTIARDTAGDPLVDQSLDDFIETGSFDPPKTLLPERPAKVMSDPLSVDEFVSTGMFEGKPLTNEDTTIMPSSAAGDDIFDVTGSSDEIPRQGTVVLPKSPLRGKNPEPPAHTPPGGKPR